MPSKTKGYEPLQSEHDTNEDEQYKLPQPRSWTHRRVYTINFILIIALSLSIITNFVLGLLHWPLKGIRPQIEYASLYGIVFLIMSREDWLINEAGLTKYVSVPYTLEGPYSLAKNRARTDKLWSEIDIDSGVIALPDSYVSEKGLPEAMRFPWDNSKGIYFVNAYHNLHCLVRVCQKLFYPRVEYSMRFVL